MNSSRRTVRAPHLNDPIQGPAHRDPTDGTCDILGRHGLDEHRCQAYLIAVVAAAAMLLPNSKTVSLAIE